MYDVLKSVISTGGYKLAEIQSKIKRLFIYGDLDEAQVNELMALASEGVSTDAERPETLKMIKSLSDKIDALAERVKTLECGSGDSSGDEEEPVAYPEWKPWDGISQDYQKGAVVSHRGKLWLSLFSGQNVWEPGAAGTETLWVEHAS